jgi:xanthine dehydrogenase accessory factor
MIGSRRKVLAIYKELEGEGVAREKLERVHAPIGLDIGAITPEEIAVAITAEMIAVRRHAEAGVRSMRYAGAAESEPAEDL